MPNPKLETYKNKATNTVYDLTDANAQASLTAILDGTSIDSFADVESALAGKVDTVSGKGLSTNDYDATAKGIVDTIQNNVKANTQLISESIWGENGKNILKNDAVSKTENNATLTVNTDKTVTVTTSGSVSANTFLNMGFFKLKKGAYILSQGVTTGNDGCRIQLQDESTAVIAYIQSGNANHIGFTLNEDKVVEGVIRIPSGWNTASIKFKPMITDANCLDQSYEPYHSSVKDTLRDAEVIEGKNKLPNAIKTGLSGNSVSITESNGALSFSGISSASTYFDVLGGMLGANKYTLPSWLVKGNTYTISDGYTSGDPRVMIAFYDSGDALIGETISRGSFTVPSTAVKVGIWVYVYTGTNTSGKVLYPMICTLDEYNADPTFEPYYIPLKDSKLTKNPTVLSSSDDLNNIKETGFYYITTTPTHAPDSRSYSALQVMKRTSDDIMQMLFTPTRMYLRHFSSGAWQSWYKFEGTEVTS